MTHNCDCGVYGSQDKVKIKSSGGGCLVTVSFEYNSLSVIS